jgi:hypothetical protein
MYKELLNNLKVEEIKKIIKVYNLHTEINMTKKTKAELIEELIKHTKLDDKKRIVLKKGLVSKVFKHSNISKKETNKMDDAISKLKTLDTNYNNQMTKLLTKLNKMADTGTDEEYNKLEAKIKDKEQKYTKKYNAHIKKIDALQKKKLKK